jgi:hypothetical protein
MKIYKEDGIVESYSPDKLKLGVRAACLAVHTPLGAAERFAKEVEGKVSGSVKNSSAITLRDLKRRTREILSLYHPDAAEVFALEEEF